MGDGLDECRAKIERAKEQLSLLQLEIEGALSEQRYGLRRQLMPDGSCEVRIVSPPALNRRWAVLAGEIIHHCRSSLDFAIWQAVLANDDRPNEGTTGFPVSTTEGEFRRRGIDMIAGVSREVQEVVEEFQPFRSEQDRSLLYVINELWKRDKHRALNLTTVSAGSYQLQPISGGVGTSFFPPLDHDALLMSFPAEESMDMEEKTTVEPAFCEPGPWMDKPLLSSLAQFIDFTQGIINKIGLELCCKAGLPE